MFKGEKQSSFRWTGVAMIAIHMALEDCMVKVFAAANAIHAFFVTIAPKDMKLTKTIRDILNDNFSLFCTTLHILITLLLTLKYILSLFII
jgi:hypothetical protein